MNKHSLRLPRVMILSMAFIGLLFFSTSAFAQHTYYISKALGSDSNTSAQAQSQSTPWAHMPGMAGCTSNCASYTPVAGDRFILRGGDTWVANDLGVNWRWSGNANARIYIGVDQSWYAGGSWARPVFDCQNSSCGRTQYGNIIWIAGNYVTFDNVEITGYRQSSGGNLVAVYANYDEVSNCYFHGWSRSETAANSFAITLNWSGGGGTGAKFHHNVIDGEDSPNKDFMGGILHGDAVYDNVIRYVYNGMNGVFNDVHGNLVEHNYVSVTGDHCNMIFVQAPFSASGGIRMYNNVVRHASCSGGMTFWMLGNTGCSNCTSYAYNNVIYDNGPDSDKGISIGSHPAQGTTGTYYIYNNTIESGGGFCIGNGEASPRSTTHYSNNHCINSSTICNGAGTTCVNDGNNLVQTLAQASSTGYAANQSFAYSPTSASSPTVGTGIRHDSFCSGSMAALCSDSTYPSYDKTNHKVVMRTAVARPVSGPWDVGAYEYEELGLPTPANLKVIN